ncbi:zinc-dependent metalloprotease [Sphingomonas qomolangmaensis]|uniref:Zinc-dependent metalloprotease n=1 Tax=Sphingomonas qomolangmaensis TaxID=2918765 RepID=A0ABY5LCH6_9SPHN|nr:zinc-dependent metalloprotease [Sphingomonas qomolangmaensis]UUL83811.1 zinc-dependent metalloprotease [Sphingomonas qomolangmaensis]
MQMKWWMTAAAVSLVGAIPAHAQSQQTAPTLLPVRANPADGRVLFTLPAADADGVSGRFLYATALRTGLGSADLRLDRGMLGGEQIIAFRRIGEKVAVTFENHRFRATGDTKVAEGGRTSFPFSIVAMLEVVDTGDRGPLVVDMTPFLTRDVIGIADTLNRGAPAGASPGGAGGGGGGGRGFRLAEGLSAVDTASVKAFPDNIEIDALQTYQTETPGREVERLSPEPRQTSFVVHHSFIRLPAPGYTARAFDIRSAAGGNQYYDYGTPLGAPVVQQVANRFRLEKTDPAAARSPVKKPIVFYIDRAAPEPIRTALMEGVNYWTRAFDAAGLVGAFRAELLPEDADPLDVRYNMVNWSNRLTRGWSYGGGIVDPRTGEIVKGNVVIGALRVRQDMIIFEGLVGTAGNGSGGPQDPVRASLDRIRQLGAHEVGHAIGIMHNFAASTQERASVMDYPGPRLKLTDGRIDLSDAYAPPGGKWDDFTVDWLYADPAPGIDPDAAARAKAKAAMASGMRFITDVDGRSADAASSWGSMWDDGADPVAHLRQTLAVRRVALTNFGPAVLRQDEPLSNLRRKFVPVWLLHRYAAEAAGKLIGGIDYSYAVAGDGQPPAIPVAADVQLAAIDAMLATLSADTLTVPAALVMPLSSATTARDDPQYTQEIFRTSGAAAFDPLVAADVAAQVTLGSLLAPARLARMVEQHRRDPSLPGLDTLFDRLEAAAIAPRQDAVGRRIAFRTVMSMARAGRDPMASPEVAAAIGDRLQRLATSFGQRGSGEDAAWRRHLATLLADDERLERELDKMPATPPVPPGMPIGETGWFGD